QRPWSVAGSADLAFLRSAVVGFPRPARTGGKSRRPEIQVCATRLTPLRATDHGPRTIDARPFATVLQSRRWGLAVAEVLLPLFPLEVVLLPEAPLPLHIFEDRYKRMIGECLDAQSQGSDREEFGVVLA